jgi:aryl-alcohol dehydrogenase-like predicted oxidoreductase
VEETLAAFGQLIEQGKVRAIGASNFSAPRLKAALDASRELGLPRYESLQPAYNLYDRSFEDELRDLCLAENVGVISYYGLASGFLTGKYRSEKDLGKSARGGRVGSYLNERGFRILKALDDVAAANRATVAQVALAWAMAKPGITAPIVSATSVEQLHEILGAARVDLDAEAMRTLDEASA